MKLTRTKAKPKLVSRLSIQSPPQVKLRYNHSEANFGSLLTSTRAKQGRQPLPRYDSMRKDFGFIFKDEKHLANEINHYDVLRKLELWDSEHCAVGKDKMERAFEETAVRSKQSAVIEQCQLLKLQRRKDTLKMKDPFVSEKSEGKHQLRYKPKSTFDYSVFTHNNLGLLKPQGAELKAVEDEAKEAPSEQNSSSKKTTSAFTQNKYYHYYDNEQKRHESFNRTHLMDIYYRIVISSFQKDKCEEILNDTYKLLEEAREEQAIINNVLKEKIKKSEESYKKSIADILESQSQCSRARKTLQTVAVIPTLSVEHKEKSDDKAKDEAESPPSSKTSSFSSSNANKGNGQSVVPSTLNSQRRRNIHPRDSMHEKLRLYVDFIAITDDHNEKIKENNKQFEGMKNELSKLIAENKSFLDKVNSSLVHQKALLETQMKKQKAYYTALLKQGVDTRAEGLTWIIKRLLELNVTVDSSFFPIYLDVDQINYLIKRSTLEHEAAKLRSMLKAIKVRKQTLLNEDNFKRLEQFASIPLKLKVTNNLIELKREDSAKELRRFIYSRFKAIYAKHEGILKKNKELLLEEVQVKQVLMNIKDKISQYAIYGKNSFDNSLEEIRKYFSQNQSQKEYYDDIKKLRNRLNEIEGEREELRWNETEMFKRKYHFVKTRHEGNKANVYYENVYSALFGRSLLK